MSSGYRWLAEEAIAVRILGWKDSWRGGGVWSAGFKGTKTLAWKKESGRNKGLGIVALHDVERRSVDGDR